ncbi:MAG: DUF4962 domain-containing protein [Kiritimatiellia bacterium]
MKASWLIWASLWPLALMAGPQSLYEEWRSTPIPSDNAEVAENPPALQWASVKHWEGRDVRYLVELSEDEAFTTGRTIRSLVQRACFFNPHAKLKPGTWHWRYEIREGANVIRKGPYSFRVPAGAPVFETPDFATFLAGLPKQHPRILTHGHPLAEVRAAAEKSPFARTILDQGRRAAAAPIYDGPVRDSDPALGRALERKAGGEVKALQTLIEAYVLSGDTTFRDAAFRRLEVVLGWPTDDLLGSQVLTVLAMTFDAFHDELPSDVRPRLLAVMERRLKHGLSVWPGQIEGRQVENHFWQVELSGNFTAALAVFDELAAGRDMLEYTYELFLARFPNLAGPDGGWAEGFGYFGVNESAVVDMALLLKHVGRVDVFQKEWYRSLPDYFIYFAPIGGRMDGFGDMHDRVGTGDIGQAMMLVLGNETGDPRALYRSAALAKNTSEAVEPWYQLVHGVATDPARAAPLAGLSQSRVFRGVGLAALHTDVLDSSRDTAVYFRSSPFGAKGHMHANQNAFNLSRRGEPLFYSTGYYTSFGDAHTMSSYRHTRAHNAILVNGCGQAFGHEGYGWIKRHLDGGPISYVCGDATMAYRQTVDRQFLDMLKESGIAPTRENGHGDSRLRLFERHLLLVRPDTVVVYDVLEAAASSEWSLLLHAMVKPELRAPGEIRLTTGRSVVDGLVAGSQPLKDVLTDQFWSPPVDSRKKYKTMPNQYHLSFTTVGTSGAMRFLTILRMADRDATPEPVVRGGGRGEFSVGGISIQAELDPAIPARLSVETAEAGLYVNAWSDVVLGSRTTAPRGPSSPLAEKTGDAVRFRLAGNLPPRPEEEP